MFLIIEGINEQGLTKFRLLESGSLAVLFPHCEFQSVEKIALLNFKGVKGNPASLRGILLSKE